MEYGKFTRERDGRLTGHMLVVGEQRRDGKHKVLHYFGSGKRITEILTPLQVQFEIAKIEHPLSAPTSAV